MDNSIETFPSDTAPHVPIMVSEISENLAIDSKDIILDGTLGYGGHAKSLIKQLGSNGHYIGLDQDETAIYFCRNQLPPSQTKSSPKVSLIQRNFSESASVLADLGLTSVTKIILDLGVSSLQIDDPERGFSYTQSGPLDMRMDTSQELTAANILSSYKAKELSDIFFHYGELRHNKKLVDAIISTRKKIDISHSDQLIELIKKSYFFHNKRSLFMKTCAQVFQALRIAVNDELGVLKSFLEDLESLLMPNGRIAIMCFHSLEDRIVKHFFRDSKELFKPVFKGILKATDNEVSENSRAKSAKLRCYYKL